MLVKELYVKNPVTKRVEVLENLEFEDSTEFSGFFRVEFLGSAEVPSKDNIVFFNKNSISKIVPELLK